MPNYYRTVNRLVRAKNKNLIKERCYRGKRPEEVTMRV